MGTIGVGSRYGFFNPEQVVKIVHFLFWFGVGEMLDGSLVVMFGYYVSEVFPFIIFICSIVVFL